MGRLVAGVALALVAGSAVAAEMPSTTQLRAAEPEQIVRYLQQIGYRAKLEKDSEGDPKIVSGMGGYTVHIYFYGCERNRDCESLQFQAGIATQRKLTLAQVNAFNGKKRFAQLHLDDEQDPWLYYDLPTGKAGISGDAFELAVDVYEDQLGELGRLIDEAAAAD